MGFGCVYQDPGRFTIRAAGHALSTRHVGVDYANGLSVVQAVDVVPDSLVCDGPFTRNAVKTFYQQHDACAELGRAEFLGCTFEGGDIHRQRMTFSDGGEVWVNRGKTSWQVPEAGVTLPTDGLFRFTGGDTLVPLPRSEPFKAKIDLAAFGAKGRRIERVEALEPAADAREPKWTQEDDALELDVDAKAFGYRLVFSGK